MSNWKQLPLNIEVAKYIDCYWFIEKNHEGGITHPTLNPDPACHIILAPAEQAFCYTLDNQEVKGKGSHVLMPNTSSIRLDHAHRFVIVGVKFKVGALYSLGLSPELPPLNSVASYPGCFENAQANLIKSSIDIESGVGIEEAIFFNHAANDRSKTCQILDDYLLPWLKGAHEDRHSELTRKALAKIESCAISDLGEALHCSQRTLERAFSRVTHITLKQYMAMQTLEALLLYIYSLETKDINWSELAVKFGFSDQPHLIRHVKNAIGHTPGAYAKHRNLTVDAYGDFSD